MPFQKGKSGNPRGRPQKDVDVQAIARRYTVEAIEVLREVMQDTEATPASRVSAAEALLARGWGRPAQAITGENGGPLALTISWLPPAAP